MDTVNHKGGGKNNRSQSVLRNTYIRLKHWKNQENNNCTRRLGEGEGDQKKKRKEKDANNTQCSQAVTHPSTNRAQRCLTSVIGQERMAALTRGKSPPMCPFEARCFTMPIFPLKLRLINILTVTHECLRSTACSYSCLVHTYKNKRRTQLPTV